MAPKFLPPAAKQALILAWFQKDPRAYSIKELEAVVPSVASIHGAQVKEFIQALTDEGLVRVEKIGSSNWYWSFVSDAKKSKEKMLGNLQAEENKLNDNIIEIELSLKKGTTDRQEEVGDEEEEVLGCKPTSRSEVLERHATLVRESKLLNIELGEYTGKNPEESLKRFEQSKLMKQSAERWTDNLEAVEGYLVRRVGDKQQVGRMLEELCSGEYTIGEGFKELS